MYPEIARGWRIPIILAALLIGPAVRALNIRPPSFSELVASADSIVSGRVAQVAPELRAVNGRQIPFTQVHIAVTEVLKGAPSREVVLQCLGGTVGTKPLHVVGAPVFNVGDEGIFFVQHNGTQFIPLVGVTHGCYWTVHDAASGRAAVLRANREPLTAIGQVTAPIDVPADGRRPIAAMRTDSALTPEQFKSQITAEIARHAP